jgi:hypothetical protein
MAGHEELLLGRYRSARGASLLERGLGAFRKRVGAI